MISKQQILQALQRVKHPESDRNLMELGMIRDIRVDDKQVKFTLVLPFKNVPIKDQLVSEARAAVEKLPGVERVTVELAEMTQKERARFMSIQHEGSAQGLNRVKHVVAVLSGKGGVGKSTVAGLLAVALRREGYKVGLLDADITGPSIPKMFFPTLKRPRSSPLGILPVESETGIKVMSINLLLPSEDEAVIWRGPLISRAIQQFWGDVFWGDLDYLVVDLPPGTADASLTVMQSIPLEGVILVTTPQSLAGMVVRKAARMTQHMGAPILGLVENMSYIVCPKCGERIEIFGPSKAAITAEKFNMPLLGRLPIDPQISKLCDAGMIEKYSMDTFAPIAKKLVASIEERTGK
ncbi:MAG TPA: iron-sulfur cluster carrier protein ApbC [Chloroflexi bacterium]|nr:iron-sulfur cluster carrier protein ApbC [Chloroflexota bacterium]